MRRSRPRIVGRAGLALAGAAMLTAAVVAQQQPPADQPAFRTGADLVIVDAVVVDKAGQPVTNLTAADFEVRDEGRAQAISLFQTVSVDAAAAPAAGPVAARRYAFSTNTGANAVPGRAFVLFFDDVHLTQAEGDRAKVALAQFLERELQAGDLVSLVAPGTALRWHARMPDGRPELTRIVAGLRGLYLPDPSSDQMSDYEAYRINAFNDEQVADQVDRRWQNARVNGREPDNLATSQGFQPQNRGGQIGIIPQDILMRAATVYQQAAARNIATLQALERTIDGLTAVRGRKAVMMLTPGFIADQERVEAKRAIDAARRANVAVYFVDARGLVASTPYAQAQQTGRGLDSRDVGAANAEITLGAEGAAEIAREHRRLLGPQPERSRPRPAADRRRVARLLPARLPAGQGRQGRRLPAARREGDAARRHGPGAPRLLRRRLRVRRAGRGRRHAAAVQRRRRRDRPRRGIALRARRHPAARRRSRLRRGERR